MLLHLVVVERAAEPSNLHLLPLLECGHVGPELFFGTRRKPKERCQGEILHRLVTLLRSSPLLER